MFRGPASPNSTDGLQEQPAVHPQASAGLGGPHWYVSSGGGKVGLTPLVSLSRFLQLGMSLCWSSRELPAPTSLPLGRAACLALEQCSTLGVSFHVPHPQTETRRLVGVV